MAAAQAALREANLYPDGGYFALRQKLSAKFGLRMEQFIIGDGSNELLELLGHAFLSPGVECVMHQASFIVYKLVTLMFGATPVEVPLVNMRQDLPMLAAAITPRTRLGFSRPVRRIQSEPRILRRKWSSFVRSLPPQVILVMD